MCDISLFFFVGPTIQSYLYYRILTVIDTQIWLDSFFKNIVRVRVNYVKLTRTSI